MSFEDLINNALNEPNYEKLQESLIYIVNKTNDTYYIARFLEPFISHVNNNNLNLFYSSLQNKDNSLYIFPSVIHNIMNDCKNRVTNYDKLLQVIQLLIQKFQ